MGLDKRSEGLGFREVTEPLGQEISAGRFRTKDGVVVIPKSELRKNKAPDVVPADLADELDSVPLPAAAPVQAKPAAAPVQRATQKVIVSTMMGDISVDCYEVHRSGRYLVLGMTNNQFTPKSYAEAPELRFDVSWDKNSSTFIYTGCRFTQQDTKTHFIVLMEAQ